MKMFWLLITILTLLLLVFLGYINGTGVISVDTNQMARIAYLGIIALVGASVLLTSRIKLSHQLRNIIFWLFVFLGLMFFYNARYDLQDFASRITDGIIPGSPVTRYSEIGTTVSLERMNNGHFETRALVNGKTISFMIDTGASSVVLSYEDALSIGIDANHLNFTIPVNTANGKSLTAPIMIDSLKVGAIERNNIQAMVAKSGAMTGSLLGMSFLDRLSGYSVRGDRMIMVD